MERQKFAIHISLVTVAGNLLLSAFKLFAGIIAHSSAMVSDAAHSASDVLSTFIVMLGVKLSAKAPDKEHPYGHERMECVAAVILSFLLFATGIGIGCSGILNLSHGTGYPAVPGMLALIAALISILSKEAMYWYTRAASKKIHSSALMADAWHHRSDALSSIGSLIGIAGARMGFAWMDPVAGIIICIFILKAAVNVFLDAVRRMTDHSCNEKLLEALRGVILDSEGVEALDDIHTRLFGDRVYVDVEISVDGTLPLSQAHQIAHKVHDRVEEEYSEIKHCMVHVNPAEQ